MTARSEAQGGLPAFDIWSSAETLANAIAKGETSSVEVTRAFLDRISQLDWKLHAYTSTFAEDALLAAHFLQQKSGRRATPNFG